ncbi:MAG: diguanylate cyclase [Rheinheimera sp.]|nr:diguanylate cyclase [Rheinheimera sp.]
MPVKPSSGRPLSLVSRLTRLNLLILAGTIFITVLLLAAVTWHSARERHLAEAAVNTEQLALNLAASVVFLDQAAAVAELQTYAQRQDVMDLVVYQRDMQVFASQPDKVSRLWQQTDSYQQLDWLQLQVRRPIRFKAETVGSVVVTESLAGLQQALLSLLLLFMLIVVLALFAASRVLRLVQRKALAPVIELAELADYAARQQDYSIRGTVRRRDEVGRLTERLNELFKRIEIWQQDLQQQLHQHQQARMQLDKLAHSDHLTGLANRLYFETELPRAVACAITQQQTLALLFIDLDNFKTVNDRWGHDAGDEVLQIVAKRMQSQLRQTDMLFRLGGDEFAVLLTDIAQPEWAMQLATRLIHSVREPMWLKNSLMPVGATVGLAFCPQDSSEAVLLLQQADQAMYQAKRAGKNTCRRFCDDES